MPPSGRQVSLELFLDIIDDRLMQRLLAPLQRQHIVGLALDDLAAIAFGVTIASMVMIAL